MKTICYLLPVAAYFYGAIPFGFLLAKAIKGVDIRQVGSGNIGATNAARVLGFKFFPVVFLLDFSKGLLPALTASLLVGGSGRYQPHPLAVGSAAAAILGHAFPVYLRFKGGKAVAGGAGACALLAPWAVMAGAVVWGGVFAVWRYVSLASICASVALAAGAWTLHADPTGAGLFRTLFCTLAAALVILLHQANIRRLIAGTEHKIGQPKQDEGPERPRA